MQAAASPSALQYLAAIGPFVALGGVIAAIAVAWGRFTTRLADIDKSFNEKLGDIAEWRRAYEDAARQRHQLANDIQRVQGQQLEMQRSLSTRQDRFEDWMKDHDQWARDRATEMARTMEAVKGLERRVDNLEDWKRKNGGGGY